MSSKNRRSNRASEQRNLLRTSADDEPYTGASAAGGLDNAIETTDGHYKYTPAFFSAIIMLIIYFGMTVMSGFELAGSNLISVTNWMYFGASVAAAALANGLIAIWAIVDPKKVSSQNIKVYQRLQWYEYVRWGAFMFFLATNITLLGFWFQWNDFGNRLSINDWGCNDVTLITNVQQLSSRQDCMFNTANSQNRWRFIHYTIILLFSVAIYGFVGVVQSELNPRFTSDYISKARIITERLGSSSVELTNVNDTHDDGDAATETSRHSATSDD